MRKLGDAEPKLVGRYRLLAELGRGGMGRVLLAAGPDGRLVAVKQVHTQLADHDGFSVRFRREIAASRTVSGAYTAAVVDADVDAATPWLASVFVPGPSLQDAVDVAGVLPEQSALRLAAGLASALIEIHRAGLVHRDLKPSNVLLTADGLRVIDFGIARALDEESTRVTRTGWLIGSPEFMSPEQAEGTELTTASDVFSLGSVLVMACTATSPFAGPSTPRTLYNLVHAEPELSALPASVRRIAELCLAKDPADRPSPEGLLAEIGEIAPSITPWPAAVQRLIDQQHAEVVTLLGGAPAAPRVETTTMAMPSAETVEVPGPARHRRWLVPLFAVVVVAAAVAGLVVWSLWSGEDNQPDGLAAVNDDPELVTDLAISPDGDVVAAVTYGGTVRMWNVDDGRQRGSKVDGVSVAFSPDGELMAVGDEGVRWYAVDTGREVGRIEFGDDPVGEVLFRPDGTLVTESGGVVQWWDLTTRQEVGRLSAVALSIAVSPDGRLIATSDTETVRLWDVATGQQAGEPVPYECMPTALTFSPDSASLAVGDACGRVTGASRSFRIGDGTVQDGHNDIHDIEFSPDGKVLAALVDDEALRLWDVAGGDTVTGPTLDRPNAFVFTSDGSGMAVSGYNDRVWLWTRPG